MEHQTFDRLTRLVGTAASRRTALGALLAGALLGVTARGAAAAPCANGKQTCGVGKECCPGKCFVSCDGTREFCCTGTDRSTGVERERIICGNTCCLDDGSDDPCEAPGCSRGGPGQVCLEGIAGSYRRR
jgi:hypothetical protein